MRKWTVYLPNNKHFELESDNPAADLIAQGHDAFGLCEITGMSIPGNPDTGKDNPLLLTVPQAARLLGLGRDTTYNLCHRADFPAIRIGRSVRINKAGLQDWLDKNIGGILL